ncbi:MAG: hypothetical protein IT359_17255 [Gemmatimonadaceae bacterium]|nr:hypothetical protein [Gemmatimonadaceae bacterium]
MALVSCTGPALSHPSRARDHFTSPLFRELCTYANREAGRWLLLSAGHGVVEPDAVITPVTSVIGRKDTAARRTWTALVIEQLAPRLTGVERILLLANARSREYLLDYLQLEGRTVLVPLEGLSLGQQLQWLRRQRDRSRAVDGTGDR